MSHFYWSFLTDIMAMKELRGCGGWGRVGKRRCVGGGEGGGAGEG